MAQDVIAALDPRQKALVHDLARGVPESEALCAHGYTATSGVVRLHHIRYAVVSELAGMLQTEKAPLAVKILTELMEDPETSSRARIDAAKVIGMWAGLALKAPRAAEQKQLADMKPDDLRAFIDKHEAEIQRLEGELAERATPVNAPIEPESVPNPLGFLD